MNALGHVKRLFIYDAVSATLIALLLLRVLGVSPDTFALSRCVMGLILSSAWIVYVSVVAGLGWTVRASLACPSATGWAFFGVSSNVADGLARSCRVGPRAPTDAFVVSLFLHLRCVLADVAPDFFRAPEVQGVFGLIQNLLGRHTAVAR